MVSYRRETVINYKESIQLPLTTSIMRFNKFLPADIPIQILAVKNISYCTTVTRLIVLFHL